MSAQELRDPCLDCNDAEASLEVRRRRLCQDCFIRYVHSKVVKRLETYRTKRSIQDVCSKVLVPLSGGISSLALLHILDQRSQRQIAKGRGRAAYELHVLIIESPHISSGSSSDFLAGVRTRFPAHHFDHIPSAQTAELVPDALKAVAGIQPGLSLGDATAHSSEPLNDLFEKIRSPTARIDVLEVLITRLVAAYAKKRQCDSVFWGHSDTRLAARTLASVAKGRGSAVPFQILDGPTPFGITFNFPMRDLFKAELETFSQVDPAFPSSLLIPDQSNVRVVSNRDLSIDQLITNYITSQGEKYPSIMANVVRTAGKLHAPVFSEQSSSCHLCGLLIEDAGASPESPLTLCYGCARSHESIRRTSSWKENTPMEYDPIYTEERSLAN